MRVSTTQQYTQAVERMKTSNANLSKLTYQIFGFKSAAV